MNYIKLSDKIFLPKVSNSQAILLMKVQILRWILSAIYQIGPSYFHARLAKSLKRHNKMPFIDLTCIYEHVTFKASNIRHKNFCPSRVRLKVPPLDSEEGWTRELWLKTKRLAFFVLVRQ